MDNNIQGAMFTYAIPGGLQPNDCAEIRGVLKGEKFYIALVSEDFKNAGNYLIKILIQNGGVWQTESKYKTEVKNIDGLLKNGLQCGMLFIINLIIMEDKIEVMINHENIGSFYKFPNGCHLSELSLDGEADFHSVEFKDAVIMQENNENIQYIQQKNFDKSSSQLLIRIDENRMSQRDKHLKSFEAPIVETNVKRRIKIEKLKEISDSPSSGSISGDDKKDRSKFLANFSIGIDGNVKINKEDIIVPGTSKTLNSNPNLEGKLKKKDKTCSIDNLQGCMTSNLGDLGTSHKPENPNVSNSLSITKKDKKSSHNSEENIHKTDWSLTDLFKKGSYTPKKKERRRLCRSVY